MVMDEQKQLQSRGLFQTMFYSMAKSFFDEAGIEINGKRKGLDFFGFVTGIFSRIFRLVH